MLVEYIHVSKDLSYVEVLVSMLDWQARNIWTKEVVSMKVLLVSMLDWKVRNILTK